MDSEVAIQRFPFKRAQNLAGTMITHAEVLVVTVRKEGVEGRGEACGVYYKGESGQTMLRQAKAALARGDLHLSELQGLLPPGGARNALDCALWELQGKLAGKSVWQLAQLPSPKSLQTTYTLGACPTAEVVYALEHIREATRIKIKLAGDGSDSERVNAVRRARPDALLTVDANQSLTRQGLEDLMPALVTCRVTLLEQPFPTGQDELLDGISVPIPLAADESVQDETDIASVARHYDVVNIKLDKCGGLTGALALANAARLHGLKIMVGCMAGTSLSLAPAYLLGQLCDYVDLDSALYLAEDRRPGVVYSHGVIECPPAVWGQALPSSPIVRE